ncbi:pectinesterase family protein [Bacteroides congonensis]
MKTRLFNKISQGVLLGVLLQATGCTETSNNFYTPDNDPPSLLSITPANGEAAEISKTIVLTFNEYVKAGEGKAIFNGTEVALTFQDKTATYSYGGLNYEDNCEFVVPPGAIADMSGNLFEGVNIGFSIMERPQPSARMFDAIVSLNGGGTHTSIQAAIDDAPKNRTEPWLIFVMNGTYDEQVIVPADKPYIHLIGQDVEKTILKLWINSESNPQADPEVWKYSSIALGKPEAAMVVVKATDFYAENISFINGFGKELQQGPMALAMYTQNDRNSFNNCKFMSYQDTWQTGPRSANGRIYAQNCWIEGAVDYFYGNGNCFMDGCTFYNMRDGAVIVAPSHAADTRWGYVMNNCVIDGNELAANGQVKLGRPWHNNPMCVYLNATFNIPIAPIGWDNMGALPRLFAEYNSKDASGMLIDLSQRRTQYEYTDDLGQIVTGTSSAILSTSEAAKYTYDNIIREGDDWNPRFLMEKVSAPANLTRENNRLSWDMSKYAICYIVLEGDKVVEITTETFCDVEEGHTYQIKAVGEYGSLSEPSQE